MNENIGVTDASFIAMAITDHQSGTPKLKRHALEVGVLMAILLVFCSFLCIWVPSELRKAEKQRQAYMKLEMDFYTTVNYGFPWYCAWLNKMTGNKDEYCYDLTCIVFNNFASINDDTLADVALFKNLEQLWLNGDISITDAGLEHLKGLKRLRDLSLADAPVTAQAVESLRQALPNCEISWEPQTKEGNEKDKE